MLGPGSKLAATLQSGSEAAVIPHRQGSRNELMQLPGWLSTKHNTEI